MNADMPYNPGQGTPEQIAEAIHKDCTRFRMMQSRGELGVAIARVVLLSAPRHPGRWNRISGIRFGTLHPDKKELEEAITGDLLGTYQEIRLMHQQGTFRTKKEPVTDAENAYWDMVIAQSAGTAISGSVS